MNYEISVSIRKFFFKSENADLKMNTITREKTQITINLQ